LEQKVPTETTRQAAGKSLRLELILADGSTYPHPGTFYFADRQVNQGTGAIRIAGLFPNPGNILRPGGYGKSSHGRPSPTGRITCTSACSLGAARRYQVAALDGENKVSIRTVKVGDRVGAQWIIVDGLKRGERVVAEGVQKVRPGIASEPQAIWRGK